MGDFYKWLNNTLAPDFEGVATTTNCKYVFLRTEKPFVHHTQIIIGTTIPWLRLLQTNLCPWLWSMEISYEGDSM